MKYVSNRRLMLIGGIVMLGTSAIVCGCTLLEGFADAKQTNPANTSNPLPSLSADVPVVDSGVKPTVTPIPAPVSVPVPVPAGAGAGADPNANANGNINPASPIPVKIQIVADTGAAIAQAATGLPIREWVSWAGFLLSSILVGVQTKKKQDAESVLNDAHATLKDGVTTLFPEGSKSREISAKIVGL